MQLPESPSLRNHDFTGEAKLSGFALTDLGNAQRFITQHGDDVRFNQDVGKWFFWNGWRWASDNSGTVSAMRLETIRSIYVEASQCDDQDRRVKVAHWAKLSEGSNRYNAILNIAKDLPPMPIQVTDFDKGNLLNSSNCVLDCDTGETRSHRREDFLSKSVGVPINRQAECPQWLECLRRWMGGKEAMIEFLQRWFGYCLTSRTNEHKIPVFYGDGGRGKSVCVNTVLDVMGDYAIQAAPGLLTLKKFNSHPTEIADLHGRRFVVCQETGEGHSLDENLVKQLVSEDMRKGRFMRQDFFQWKPTEKFILCTNHRPIISDTDNGIWRRILLVPWDVDIPIQEQDPYLSEKLLEEGQGILAWMIDGLEKWRESGLEIPDEIKIATAKYRTDMDTFGGFIDECCEIIPGNQNTYTISKVLRERYEQWCGDIGAKPLGTKKFAEKLRTLGCEDSKLDKYTRIWNGIRIVGETP